ncbi:hypothetical protein FC17_GL002575 [Secundilactobacillus paracollinoides DSM 15502 = JCM 11969]|nr:hypothetical protein FC17_GL002575 [Secundilactobacillus paracollinoides DSM 15502 = JCM 11969]
MTVSISVDGDLIERSDDVMTDDKDETRLTLELALLTLLESHTLETITPQEVVTVAEVPIEAFNARFSSVRQLNDVIFTTIKQALMQTAQTESEDGPVSVKKTISSLLAYSDTHRELLRLVCKTAEGRQLITALADKATKSLKGIAKQYPISTVSIAKLSYLVYAATGVMIQWVSGSLQLTRHQMGPYLHNLVML